MRITGTNNPSDATNNASDFRFVRADYSCHAQELFIRCCKQTNKGHDRNSGEKQNHDSRAQWQISVGEHSAKLNDVRSLSFDSDDGRPVA
jgi:hypothetical protein